MGQQGLLGAGPAGTWHWGTHPRAIRATHSQLFPRDLVSDVPWLFGSLSFWSPRQRWTGKMETPRGRENWFRWYFSQNDLRFLSAKQKSISHRRPVELLNVF